MTIRSRVDLSRRNFIIIDNDSTVSDDRIPKIKSAFTLQAEASCKFAGLGGHSSLAATPAGLWKQSLGQKSRDARRSFIRRRNRFLRMTIIDFSYDLFQQNETKMRVDFLPGV